MVLRFHNLHEKNMVNDGVAPRLEITFHTVHSYRVYGNRSKLEISALFSPENWENKFGSTNSHFFFGWTLYAHKLHAPCSQAFCSRSHASVVDTLCTPSLPLLAHQSTLPAHQSTLAAHRSHASDPPMTLLQVKMRVNLFLVEIHQMSKLQIKCIQIVEA